MPHYRNFHSKLYLVAFLERDEAGMAEQIAWAQGKPRDEELMLWYASLTSAFYGKLGEADKLMQRSLASAGRAGAKEGTSDVYDERVLRASLFGNASEVKRAAKADLLRLGSVGTATAIALALSGDASQARKLNDGFAEHYLEDSCTLFTCTLHTIRAVIALNQGDPLKAIGELDVATPDEHYGCMLIVYLRGKAYLSAHQGGAAAAEFNEILAHPYLVLNNPIGALAHLGLARAYALQGDTTKAKAAYQDFLLLWKDADPDIPILIAAKSEYAKLH